MKIKNDRRRRKMGTMVEIGLKEEEEDGKYQ